MTDIPDTSQYHQLIQFPFIGHRMVDLVDNTYAMALSGSLVEGHRIADPGHVEISIYKNGKPMDVYYSVLGVPIVSAGAAEVLRETSPNEVQLFPARWREPEPNEATAHFVANICSLVDCAVAAGTHDFLIDTEKAAGHDIFRLKTNGPAIIISERLRRALICARLVIAGFIPCRLA